MKEFVNRSVFRKDVPFTLLIVLAILFTAAFACESGGDKVPTDSEIQSLVKETMADFTNAIDTEDFSKLHAKASSDFQSSYTVAQMKDAFESIIDKKDLAMPSLKNAGSVNASFLSGAIDSKMKKACPSCS